MGQLQRTECEMYMRPGDGGIQDYGLGYEQGRSQKSLQHGEGRGKAGTSANAELVFVI